MAVQLSGSAGKSILSNLKSGGSVKTPTTTSKTTTSIKTTTTPKTTTPATSQKTPVQLSTLAPKTQPTTVAANKAADIVSSVTSSMKQTATVGATQSAATAATAKAVPTTVVTKEADSAAAAIKAISEKVGTGKSIAQIVAESQTKTAQLYSQMSDEQRKALAQNTAKNLASSGGVAASTEKIKSIIETSPILRQPSGKVDTTTSAIKAIESKIAAEPKSIAQIVAESQARTSQLVAQMSDEQRKTMAKNIVSNLEASGGIKAQTESIKSVGESILARITPDATKDKTTSTSEKVTPLYSSGIKLPDGFAKAADVQKLVDQLAARGGIEAKVESLKELGDTLLANYQSKVSLTPIVQTSQGEDVEKAVVSAIETSAAVVDNAKDDALTKYSTSISALLDKTNRANLGVISSLSEIRQNYLDKIKSDAVNGVASIQDLMKAQLAAAKDAKEVEEITNVGKTAIKSITDVFDESASKVDTESKLAANYVSALNRYNTYLPETYKGWITELAEQSKTGILSNLVDHVQANIKDTTVLFGINPAVSKTPVQLSKGVKQNVEIHYTTNQNTANNVARALYGTDGDKNSRVSADQPVKIKEILDQIKDPSLRASYVNLLGTQGVTEDMTVVIENLPKEQREVINTTAIGAARAKWDIGPSSKVTVDEVTGKTYTPALDQTPYRRNQEDGSYTLLTEQGGMLGFDREETIGTLAATITQTGRPGDWAYNKDSPLNVAVSDLSNKVSASYAEALKKNVQAYNPKTDSIDLSKLSDVELYQLVASTQKKSKEPLVLGAGQRSMFTIGRDSTSIDQTTGEVNIITQENELLEAKYTTIPVKVDPPGPEPSVKRLVFKEGEVPFPFPIPTPTPTPATPQSGGSPTGVVSRVFDTGTVRGYTPSGIGETERAGTGASGWWKWTNNDGKTYYLEVSTGKFKEGTPEGTMVTVSQDKVPLDAKTGLLNAYANSKEDGTVGRTPTRYIVPGDNSAYRTVYDSGSGNWYQEKLSKGEWRFDKIVTPTATAKNLVAERMQGGTAPTVTVENDFDLVKSGTKYTVNPSVAYSGDAWNFSGTEYVAQVQNLDAANKDLATIKAIGAKADWGRTDAEKAQLSDLAQKYGVSSSDPNLIEWKLTQRVIPTLKESIPVQVSQNYERLQPAQIHYTTDANTSNNLSRALHGAEGAVTPTTKVSKNSLLSAIDPKARSQYESMFKTMGIPDNFTVQDLTNEQRDIVNAAGIAGAQSKGLTASATPTKDAQGNTFVPDPNSMGWTTEMNGYVKVLTSQGGSLQGTQGITKISANFSAKEPANPGSLVTSIKPLSYTAYNPEAIKGFLNLKPVLQKSDQKGAPSAVQSMIQAYQNGTPGSTKTIFGWTDESIATPYEHKTFNQVVNERRAAEGLLTGTTPYALAKTVEESGWLDKYGEAIKSERREWSDSNKYAVVTDIGTIYAPTLAEAQAAAQQIHAATGAHVEVKEDVLGTKLLGVSIAGEGEFDRAPHAPTSKADQLQGRENADGTITESGTGLIYNKSTGKVVGQTSEAASKYAPISSGTTGVSPIATQAGGAPVTSITDLLRLYNPQSALLLKGLQASGASQAEAQTLATNIQAGKSEVSPAGQALINKVDSKIAASEPQVGWLTKLKDTAAQFYNQDIKGQLAYSTEQNQVRAGWTAVADDGKGILGGQYKLTTSGQREINQITDGLIAGKRLDETLTTTKIPKVDQLKFWVQYSTPEDFVAAFKANPEIARDLTAKLPYSGKQIEAKLKAADPSLVNKYEMAAIADYGRSDLEDVKQVFGGIGGGILNVITEPVVSGSAGTGETAGKVQLAVSPFMILGGTALKPLKAGSKIVKGTSNVDTLKNIVGLADELPELDKAVKSTTKINVDNVVLDAKDVPLSRSATQKVATELATNTATDKTLVDYARHYTAATGLDSRVFDASKLDPKAIAVARESFNYLDPDKAKKISSALQNSDPKMAEVFETTRDYAAGIGGVPQSKLKPLSTTAFESFLKAHPDEVASLTPAQVANTGYSSAKQEVLTNVWRSLNADAFKVTSLDKLPETIRPAVQKVLDGAEETLSVNELEEINRVVDVLPVEVQEMFNKATIFADISKVGSIFEPAAKTADDAASIVAKATDPTQANALSGAFRAGDYEIPQILAKASDNLYTNEVASRVVKFQGVSGAPLNSDTLRAVQVKSAQTVLTSGSPADVYKLLSDGDFARALADMPEDAFTYAVSNQPTTLGFDVRRARAAAIKADARPKINSANVAWDMATDAPAAIKAAPTTVDDLVGAALKQTDEAAQAANNRALNAAQSAGTTVDEVLQTTEAYRLADAEVKVAEKNLTAAQDSLDLINKLRAVDDTPELAAKAKTLEADIESQQTSLKQAIAKLTSNKAKMASVAGPVGKGQVKMDEVFKYADDFASAYRSPDEWSKFASEISKVVKDDADVRAYLKTLSHTESDALARRLAKTVGDGQAGARVARDVKLAHYESIIDEMKLDPAKWNRLSEADKSWAENLYLQGTFTDRDLLRFKKIADTYDHSLAYRMFRATLPSTAFLKEPISPISAVTGTGKNLAKLWLWTTGLGFLGFIGEEAFQTAIQFASFTMDDDPQRKADYLAEVIPSWQAMTSKWDSTLGAAFNTPGISTVAAILCPTGWAFDKYISGRPDSAASYYLRSQVIALSDDYGLWVMDGSNNGLGRAATEAEAVATWRADPSKFLRFAKADPEKAYEYLDLQRISVDGHTRYKVGPNNIFLPGANLTLEQSDALLYHLYQEPGGSDAAYKLTKVRDELQLAGVVDGNRDEEPANKQYLEDVYTRDLAHQMAQTTAYPRLQGAGTPVPDEAVNALAAKWSVSPEEARRRIDAQLSTGAWAVTIDPATGEWTLERTAFTPGGGSGGSSGGDSLLSGSGDETATKETYTITVTDDPTLRPPSELPGDATYGEKAAWSDFRDGSMSINDITDPYGVEAKALKKGLTLSDGSANLNGVVQMFGPSVSIDNLKNIFGEAAVINGLSTLDPTNPMHARIIQDILNDPSLKYSAREFIQSWSQGDPDKVLSIPGLTDSTVKSFLGEKIPGVVGVTSPFSSDAAISGGSAYLVPYLAAGHPEAIKYLNSLPVDEAGAYLNDLAVYMKDAGINDPFLLKNILTTDKQAQLDEFASNPANFDIGVRVTEGELYWYDGTGKEHSTYIIQGDMGFRPDLNGQFAKVDSYKILGPDGKTVYTLSVNPAAYAQWVKDYASGATNLSWDEFKNVQGAYAITGSYTHKDGAPAGSYDMTVNEWSSAGPSDTNPFTIAGISGSGFATGSGGSSDKWSGFKGYGGGGYGGGSWGSSWSSEPVQTGLFVDSGGLKAEIYYEGQLIGYTDGDIIPMEPGEYKLTFKKPGYQSRTQVVMIYTTKTTSIYVKLYEGSDPISICDYIDGIGGSGKLTYGHVCHIYALYRKWKYSAEGVAKELTPAPTVLPTSITKDEMLFLIYLAVGDVAKAQALADANKVCVSGGE